MNIENPGASAQAIQHHYDVSTEFFALWLDPSLTYSSALWLDGETFADHEAAQMRKLDYHIGLAGAKNARRVLDVGFGWGSLLRRLVDVHGVAHVVGLSLSQAHIDHVSSWQHPRLDVRLESWSDHVPEEPYDCIISLEVFEHFAKLGDSSERKVKGYRDFFRCCHDWLKPGGMVSIQTLTYENSAREDFSDFIARDIFPESDFARQSEIFQAADRLFEVVSFHNWRGHYVRTLRCWLKGLQTHRTEAARLVGKDTVDKYEKYLGLSLISLHTGANNVSYFLLRRVDAPGRPRS